METFKIIREIFIAKMEFDEEDIHPGSHLRNDLALDSLDMVELIMETEMYFKISISDLDIENANTVSDLADLVDEIIAP